MSIVTMALRKDFKQVNQTSIVEVKESTYEETLPRQLNFILEI